MQETVAATAHHSDLIICPDCDAAYHARLPDHGERAVCARCHSVLISPRRKAGMQIISLSVAVVILVGIAALYPFLSIEAGGLTNAVSVLDAALAFSSGPLVLLAFGTFVMILFVPLLRVLLVLYVLVPVVFDRPPLNGARRAFSLSEALRPWSMAEIFAMGCAVALIKVADLAQIAFGPAFWVFSVLVVLVIIQDAFLCRWSVWTSLERPQTPAP